MKTKKDDLDEIKSDAFTDGQRSVWRSLVQQGLCHLEGNEKTRTELLAERADAIRELKSLCEELGLPIEWEDDLHMADIIEKHIYRPLRGKINSV